MGKLRKILGIFLEIWGGVRFVVDLLSSLDATKSYGHYAYVQLAASPASRTLTITVIAVGLALLLYEPLKRLISNRGWVAESRSTLNGPRLVATFYGPAKDAPSKHGLWVENEADDPALEISVGDVPIGRSTLKFDNYKLPRLTKAHEPAFFNAWIERSAGHTLFGSGLREEMIQEKVAEIIVSITYKDANEHYYLSPAKIEPFFTNGQPPLPSLPLSIIRLRVVFL